MRTVDILAQAATACIPSSLQSSFIQLPEMAESKIKDMRLDVFGRKELILAEHEMLGLIICQKEYGPS